MIKNADLSFVNLECVIAKSGYRWDKTLKVFFFRVEPTVFNVLKDAGIDLRMPGKQSNW